MQKNEKSHKELIPELIKAHARTGELTSDIKRVIADKLDIPVTLVEQTATFFPSLSVPRAKYRIALCKSLPCSMENSGAVYKSIKKELKIGKNGISRDGKYCVTQVNCLGLCDQGPAMMVNDRIHTGLSETKPVLKILKQLKNKNN